MMLDSFADIAPRPARRGTGHLDLQRRLRSDHLREAVRAVAERSERDRWVVSDG